MRIIAIIVVLAILTLIYGLQVRSRDQKDSSPDEPSSTGPPAIIGTHVSPDPQEDRPVRLLDVAKIADRLHAEDSSATEDLEIITSLIDHYRQLYKKVPSGGLNEEIIAAMSGKNAKRLALISPKHPAISKQGELIDRFGTAYYFHPLSRSEIEVRSAGPDLKLFTKDDVIAEE